MYIVHDNYVVSWVKQLKEGGGEREGKSRREGGGG